MSTYRETEVIDTRFQEASTPQQRQAIAAGEQALAAIDGCTCVVLLAFLPDGRGGATVEIGVSGRGARGFGAVVERTMHQAANTVGAAMTRQEQDAPS